MGSALTDRFKTQFPQDADHLRGLEHRCRAHVQAGTTICCRPTKSLSRLGSPSSSSNGDHLLEIGLQLVERCPLAMGAGEARHMAHKQTCLAAALDHSGVGTHDLAGLHWLHRRYRVWACRLVWDDHLRVMVFSSTSATPLHTRQDSPMPRPSAGRGPADPGQPMVGKVHLQRHHRLRGRHIPADRRRSLLEEKQ
jgi:hypothetical protein